MKSFLIAKSNLRKFKGLSICLLLLILISSMFITALFLLQTDFKSNTKRNSDKLNTSDIMLINTGYYNDEASMQEYLSRLDGLEDYLYTKALYSDISCKYGSGKNMFSVFIETEDAFERNISEVEIIKEKKSITDNYIYLPYQFYKGGKIKLGEDYKLDFGTDAEPLTVKVKGFINSTYGGCMNMGIVEFVASDGVYNQIHDINPKSDTAIIYLNLNKDIDNIDAHMSRFISDIKINEEVELNYSTEIDVVENRAFMGDIFFVILLMVLIVVLAITMLSIYNNISSYIKENMKTLGILKAIGYTSNNIRMAIILQFSIILASGVILGILGGYLFVPSISGILIAQSGLPYQVSFDLISTIAPIIIVPIFIYLIILLSLIKVKKIEAVTALKDTGSSYISKYNPIKLSKTKGNINLVIAIKNTFNSLKQNIINFIVIIFVSILLVTSVTFYENFDRNPNVSLVTGEYSDVFLGVVEGNYDSDTTYTEYIYNELKKDSRIKNVRLVDSMALQDENYVNIYVLAEDNLDYYRNKDYVYKGRFPKNENEVVISGKYAKENGYKIGDEIKLSGYEKDIIYTITGFVQSTNNLGREAVMSFEGLDRVAPQNVRHKTQTIYFDVLGDSKKLVEEYKANELYKDYIADMITFEEALDSSIETFRTLSESLVLIIVIISIADIGLVMFMLLKSLIHKRRYEYGIMKALGFTSRQLIVQNVVSFTPLIIAGTLVGCLIGYFSMNYFFTIGMQSFGIMKCNLLMPVDLIWYGGIFVIIISFIAVYLMSRRIKKIEPYKLLIEE